MADTRTLTIRFKAEGGEKISETLRTIKREGDKVYTTVLKDGKLVSESMRTVTGAARTNYSAITALATSYTAFAASIAGVVRFMQQSVAAAREDELSIVRRNTALRESGGFTSALTVILEDQAAAMQRLHGISDSYTREIQAQYLALGAQSDAVDELTEATIALANITGGDAQASIVKLSKFLEGTTNAVRGTTLAVDADATAIERWTAVLEFARTGQALMTEEMDTGMRAADRLREGWGEVQEAFGGISNTDIAKDAINRLAGALFSVSDWVSDHGSDVVAFIKYIVGGVLDIEGFQNQLRINAGERAATRENIVGPRSMLSDAPSGLPFSKRKGGGGAKAPISHAFNFGIFGEWGGGEYPGSWDVAAMEGQLPAWFGMGPLGRNRRDAYGRLNPQIARAQLGGNALGDPRSRWLNQPAMLGVGYEGHFTRNYTNTPWWQGKGAGQGAQMLGGLMSGGIGGLGAAAGGIFGGPLGALLGGGIGRTLGGLFGGHKKQNRDGQTQATAFVVQSQQLEDIKTAILRIAPQLRVAGQGLNMSMRQIATQGAR